MMTTFTKPVGAIPCGRPMIIILPWYDAVNQIANGLTNNKILRTDLILAPTIIDAKNEVRDGVQKWCIKTGYKMIR